MISIKRRHRLLYVTSSLSNCTLFVSEHGIHHDVSSLCFLVNDFNRVPMPQLPPSPLTAITTCNYTISTQLSAKAQQLEQNIQCSTFPWAACIRYTLLQTTLKSANISHAFEKLFPSLFSKQYIMPGDLLYFCSNNYFQFKALWEIWRSIVSSAQPSWMAVPPRSQHYLQQQ